jgi:hypothetical protein
VEKLVKNEMKNAVVPSKWYINSALIMLFNINV